MSASTADSKSGGRFAWLKPPQGGTDGTMTLIDHIKELRYRVTIAVIAIIVVAIASGFFYNEIMQFIAAPYETAKADVLAATDGAATIELTNLGVVSPFTLAIVGCLLAGLVFSSPVWLYQLWAFVAPALLKNEKKYVLLFVGFATPLFLAGCALGYIVWPRGVALMLSFTPRGMEIVNLLDMVDFLQKEVMIMLVFGISFMLPLLLVMLNLARVVHGFQLGKARKFVILGSTILAAVVTPTVDPFSMLALVIPLTTLFLVAEVICRLIDKKRGITEENATEFSVDLDDGK